MPDPLPVADVLPVVAAAQSVGDAMTTVGALGGAGVGVALLAWHVWREVHRG